MNTYWKLAVGGAVALAVMAGAATSAEAAEKCNLTRDLDIGTTGEDVRCLQKFLNGAGYIIASNGVGSPGRETNQYKDLTKAAVAKWQAANNISPATGFFGPKSRAVYNSAVSGTPAATNAAPQSSAAELAALQAQLDDLLKQKTNNSNSNNNNTPAAPATVSTSDKSVRDLILLAIREVNTAENEIEDAVDDGEAVGSALSDLEDAKDNLFDAVKAYFAGNLENARNYADDAIDNADDAYEEAGGETEEDEIEEMIDEVEDDIEAAWITIEEAQTDGDDVDEAEDLLEEAEDTIDAANDALDDEDFDEAEELADEAADLVDDALDAIGDSDDEEDEADEAIDEAVEAINDAWDEVEEAADDGEDTDDAEDLLEEAEDALDEAEDAFDDEDYDEAIDLAEEAMDLVDEALDEI